MMNLLHQTSFVLRAQKLWMWPLKWNQPLLCQCFCKGQFRTAFSSWHLGLLFVVGEWWRVKRWIPPCLRSQLCSFHSSSYLACSKGCKLLEGITFTSVKGFGTINQTFLFLLLSSILVDQCTGRRASPTVLPWPTLCNTYLLQTGAHKSGLL